MVGYMYRGIYMKTIFQRIKLSVDLLSKNFIITSISVALIKVISLLFLKFTTSFVFDRVLFDAQIKGITNENFVQVLKHPLALILLLLVIGLVCVLMLLEMMLLILYFNHTYSSSKITVKNVVLKLKGLMKPSFVLFAIYVLLVMPNMNLGISASYAANIKVPRFIIDTLYEQPLLTYAYFAVLAVLFYAPVIYVLEDVSFQKAC